MNARAKSILLLFFFSLCAAAFIVTNRQRNETPAPSPRELYAVVNQQLSAFRADDFPRAYLINSNSVQQKFSLPQFESMVRHSYASMTVPTRVEFGAFQINGATAHVQVFFFRDDGAQAFLYELVAEDGTWKIEGVEPIPMPRPRRTLADLRA